jgi:hypothetical protein
VFEAESQLYQLKSLGTSRLPRPEPVPSIMPFKLDKVDAAKDFDALIECEWVAHEKPNQPFFRLFCPVHGDGEAARQEWMKESTDRQREWFESDPHSTWLKVVDTESGALVGGALWKIFEENPFAKPDDQDHEVTWFPADSTRDFVGQALEIFDAPRARLAQRPHVCMFMDLGSGTPTRA